MHARETSLYDWGLEAGASHKTQQHTGMSDVLDA